MEQANERPTQVTTTTCANLDALGDRLTTSNPQALLGVWPPPESQHNMTVANSCVFSFGGNVESRRSPKVLCV